ncbi:MAG: N-acetylmuramoyl-L-alanine amidase, partial [Actinomycetia bacterium]|nr:N-acetylmuramoyl-L-alanine amidase [Actinomycetes bacterium]
MIIKRVLVVFLIFLISISSLYAVSAEKSLFKYNGNNFEILIYTVANIGYIKLLDIIEILDLSYGFDTYMEKGLIKGNNKTLIFNIGNNRVLESNRLLYLETAPFLYKGIILLPVQSLDVISEVFFENSLNYSLNISKKLKKEKYSIIKEPSDETFIKKENIVKIKESQEKIKFIIIDAGHGGKDPGAIGFSGTKEKDIVSSVAYMISDLLRKKHPGIKTVLTRNKDKFIKLEERTKIANSYIQDNLPGIFISIHANASLNRKAKGFEIFYLSPEASDDEARAVAAIENGVLDMENISGNDRNYLQKSLWQMILNEFIRESRELAELILNSITGIKELEKTRRKIRTADFYVLRGVAMPSILVELGFVTNPEEEKLLNRKDFQKKLSESIVTGIEKFLIFYEKNIE